jgi:HD-like signal output (HDOD) protein
VLNERIFDFVSARNGLSTQPGAPDSLRELPHVPVFSETLLRMELAIRSRSVDLTEISRLVLSDPGAALQIMRLAAREDACEDNRVPRIEDCISGLGVHACLDAMSRAPLKWSTRPPAVIETWMHARIIAENCRFLAEETSVSVNPEDAYLVGLLHDLGAFPVLLGWSRTFALPADPALAGLYLARAWSLPQCVGAYFFELWSHTSNHGWSAIVEQAHPDAQYSLSACVLGHDVAMQVHSGASLQLA